jgi:hypothetical protein
MMMRCAEDMKLDDLGLSPEFLDPNNFDAFDNEEIEPQGNKSCVCGREVVRFDVYRFIPDCFCDYEGLTCEADHGQQTVSGIVGVLADGSSCCSAMENLSEQQSYEWAARFNAREHVALSQEV